ncbi:MAG: RNA methyltransferase [Candidatus Kapabacteria bacterium]|nr:RNA methyltransferase [Candidatus Kapabacteria bacterium]MCS7301936.1 RNA methyltransferase [Candidatus Kapabacteria bacterium]
MEQLPPLSKTRQRWIAHLHSKRYRHRERCFLAEGIRTVAELAISSYRTVLVVCTEQARKEHPEVVGQFLQQGVACYTATPEEFKRLADTTSPQGILAVVAFPDTDTKKTLSGSVVLLDGIADPGNAGTIVRTAYWFGYTGVILSDDSVERFNPKFVRATMGALFHIPVLEIPASHALERYRDTHRIIGTCAEGGIPLAQYSTPSSPHLLVIGNEARGLSQSVIPLVHDFVTIEGQGSFDSLNAAVAAGIVMYHLCRQR